MLSNVLPQTNQLQTSKSKNRCRIAFGNIKKVPFCLWKDVLFRCGPYVARRSDIIILEVEMNSSQ